MDQAPPSRENPDHERSEKRTLEHAAAGYKNAQDTIRFVDTKNGVVVGLVLGSIGFVAQSAKWFLALPFAEQERFSALLSRHPLLFIVIGVSGFASLICGMAALLNALDSLTARGPDGSKFTVLFPFHGPEDADRKEAADYYTRIRKTMSFADIADEYEWQIFMVGEILFKKIWFHKRAIQFLVAQLELITVGVVFFIWLQIYARTDHASVPTPSSASSNGIVSQPLPTRVPTATNSVTTP